MSIRHDGVPRLLASLVGPLLVLTSVSMARADEREDVAPLDTRALRAWDHVELSMGFIAGQRRYTQTPWTLSQGGLREATHA